MKMSRKRALGLLRDLQHGVDASPRDDTRDSQGDTRFDRVSRLVLEPDLFVAFCKRIASSPKTTINTMDKWAGRK
jgi:hypothetical protein